MLSRFWHTSQATEKDTRHRILCVGMYTHTKAEERLEVSHWAPAI